MGRYSYRPFASHSLDFPLAVSKSFRLFHCVRLYSVQHGSTLAHVLALRHWKRVFPLQGFGQSFDREESAPGRRLDDLLCRPGVLGMHVLAYRSLTALTFAECSLASLQVANLAALAVRLILIACRRWR